MEEQISQAPQDSPPERKPGGQPGNQNAVKHGFYSRHYRADERHRLANIDELALTDEIELLRVFMDRVAAIVGEDGKKEITGKDLKAINSLALMTQSIATLVRTHYLTRGKGGAIEETIMEALQALALNKDL